MPQYVDIHTHKLHGRNIEILSLRLNREAKTCISPCSAGIHPWDAEDLWPWRDEILERLVAMPVSAIGEIGLDHAVQTDRNKQIALLRRQISIAVQKNCPVILHSVRATGDMLGELRSAGMIGAIFHGFTGNALTAMQIVAAGHYISLGERSFRSLKTIGAIGSIPLNRLFLETDESDESIETIYSAAARIMQLPVEKLIEVVEQNYKTLFR